MGIAGAVARLRRHGLAALAVDDYGHADVLARVAARMPGREAGVQVMRWTGEAELVWQLLLPLALADVEDPVALALTPDGELVLGGFVAGARHVEMLSPECRCG